MILSLYILVISCYFTLLVRYGNYIGNIYFDSACNLDEENMLFGLRRQTMTTYLFGDCDSRIADIQSDDNSFRPSFQHVFKESYPSTYIEVKQKDKNGSSITRLFDLSKRRYVDISDKKKD